MANIGDVTARLRADVGPYISGMQQAGAANRQFSQSGTETTSRTEQIGIAFQRLERREPTMALRQVRGALTMLSLEAVGATGPLGRMAESIALLGAGSALVLGALAGLAAFVAAVKISERGAEEATKAHEALAAAMEKVLTKSATAAAANAMEAAVTTLEAAQTRLDEVYQHFKETPSDFAKRLQGLQNDVNTASATVDRLRGSFRGVHNELAQNTTDALHQFDVQLQFADLYGRSLAETLQGIQLIPIDLTGLADLNKTGGSVADKFARANTELAQLAAQITKLAQTPQERFRQQMQDIAAVGGLISPETADRASKMAGKELQRALDPSVKEFDDHMSRQMERAGYHAMQALIDGILRGKADFQDIFLSILEAFLSAGLNSVFGKVLGTAGLGGGGGKGFKDVSAMAKFSINVPPAADPITFARDAQWQRAFRETAIVARQSGFRG